MKKFLLFLTLILSIGLTFSSCKKEEVKIAGNSQLSFKGIKISGFGSASAIKGVVKMKVYTLSDTSSYIVTENSITFNLLSSTGFDQTIAYDFNDRTAKIEVTITFNIEGSTATRLSIDNISFINNNSTKYSADNILYEGSPFSSHTLNPITINF